MDPGTVAAPERDQKEHERDQAVQARAETQAAMREQLLASAEVLRTSNNRPDRRVAGLGMLKQAAALKPGPAQQAKLANQAVEFLAGAAGVSGDADGVGTAARFDGPTAIAIDAIPGRPRCAACSTAKNV